MLEYGAEIGTYVDVFVFLLATDVTVQMFRNRPGDAYARRPLAGDPGK